MNASPTISIIVPVYNGERYIGDCLQALFNQTCPPHEILVVDDGSTDLTAECILPRTSISTTGRNGVEPHEIQARSMLQEIYSHGYRCGRPARLG